MTGRGWETYRGGVSANKGASPPEGGDRVADAVNSAISQGLELISAVRARRRANPSPASEARELERVHRAAVVQHESAVRAYRSRLWRARAKVMPMATTSAVTGTLAVVTVVTVATVPPVAVALAAVSGVTALSAYRSRQLSHNPPPEPTAILPAPPPPTLRTGSRGDAETRRLLRIRNQLSGLIPAVAHLHPEAGAELARADSEAGPALNALVYRLSVLDHIERALPSSEASRQAAQSADSVARRLAVGVDAYDLLVAAAAALLAAPDIGRSSDDVLGPAIDALAAYAHGLTVSAETFSTDVT